MEDAVIIREPETHILQTALNSEVSPAFLAVTGIVAIVAMVELSAVIQKGIARGYKINIQVGDRSFEITRQEELNNDDNDF